MKVKGFGKEKTPFKKKALGKKAIAVGTTLLGVAIATVVIATRQEEPEPYSASWLGNLSDDELAVEREKARLACRNTGHDWGLALERERIFNKVKEEEIRRRQRDDTGDYVFPVHGEHGTNLYKPD